MSNNTRQLKYVPLSQEQTRRYIEEARELRNETIKRGIGHMLAGLRRGVRTLRAWAGSSFRPITGKGARGPRAC